MSNVILIPHCGNLHPDFLTGQAAVLDKLVPKIERIYKRGRSHAEAIDLFLGEDRDPTENILILDADCIPMTRLVVEEAFTEASNGGLFGIAQSANHIDPDEVYVGPAFMAFNRHMYELCGRPSFEQTPRTDVGQQMTRAAIRQRIPIEYLWPTSVAEPRWKVKGHEFGIGTSYGGLIFHLFCAREATDRQRALWNEVVGDMLQW
jgi:hypothetical protein